MTNDTDDEILSKLNPASPERQFLQIVADRRIKKVPEKPTEESWRACRSRSRG